MVLISVHGPSKPSHTARLDSVLGLLGLKLDMLLSNAMVTSCISSDQFAFQKERPTQVCADSCKWISMFRSELRHVTDMILLGYLCFSPKAHRWGHSSE